MHAPKLGALILLSASLLASDARAEGDPTAQLTGRWVKRARLESVTRMPVVGDISQKTEIISLLEIRPGDGGALLYREKTCRLATKTLGGFVRTTYPTRFLRMLRRDWSPIQLTATGDRLTLVQHKARRCYGEAGADEDQDGHPGVTIEVNGIIGGEIYASIEESSTASGTVIGPDTIEGTVDWNAGLHVLGATSGMLRKQPKTRRKEDPEARTFVMKRVPDNATCAAVLNHLDDVF